MVSLAAGKECRVKRESDAPDSLARKFLRVYRVAYYELETSAITALVKASRETVYTVILDLFPEFLEDFGEYHGFDA